MANASAYLAEFVGTFILVFTVGCNVLSKQAVWAGVSIASSLMVGIYALAPISGANFNPAVSMALGLAGKLPWTDVAKYAVAQILGGVAAAFGYSFLMSASLPLVPSEGFSGLSVAACELLYTFVLCFVVLNVAASANQAKGQHQFYGLAIGLVIVAGAYGAGAVSGGCFNPAVALGIELGSRGFRWSALYVFSELAGAALAAGLFKIVRPATFENGEPAGLLAKLASEFLGTYVLVLTVGLNVIAKSPAAAFSIAASLTCMIFALGDVSGAHFNPAVTMAILAIKKIDAKEAAMYMCSQIFGGMAAACTYVMIRGGASFALGPGKGFNLAAAGVAELFFTFVLCFVVLSVACSPTASKGKAGGYSEYFGLAIGSCITTGGFAIGAVSGGSLNPAVSFGIVTGDAIGDGNWAGIKEALAYTVFELCGAGVAAGLYMATHGLSEKEKSEVDA